MSVADGPHFISVPAEVRPSAPLGEQNAPGCTPCRTLWVVGPAVVGIGFGREVVAAGLGLAVVFTGVGFRVVAAGRGEVGADATTGEAAEMVAPGVGSSRTRWAAEPQAPRVITASAAASIGAGRGVTPGTVMRLSQ